LQLKTTLAYVGLPLAVIVPVPLLYACERILDVKEPCIPFLYLAVQAGLTTGLAYIYFARRGRAAPGRGPGIPLLVAFGAALIWWTLFYQLFTTSLHAIFPLPIYGPCEYLLLGGFPISIFLSVLLCFLFARIRHALVCKPAIHQTAAGPADAAVSLRKPSHAAASSGSPPGSTSRPPALPVLTLAAKFKSAREPGLSGLMAALHRAAILCNFSAAALLAISGYGYYTRRGFFVIWLKSFFPRLLWLLPHPDLLTHFLLPQLFFQVDFHRSGYLFFGLALFMAALAIGLLLAWRWAFLLELLICLAAVANRFFVLDELRTSRYPLGLPPSDRADWLYFLGLIPAFLFAFYSYRRFVSSYPARRSSGAAAITGTSPVSMLSVPAGVIFCTLSAVFFYGVAVAHAAAHLDYWPKRYLILHAALLGLIYLAVMILAAVPRWRDLACAAGLGVAMGSFFALSLSFTLNPLPVVLGLLYAMGAAQTGQSGGIFLFGFLASNVLLAGAAIWRAGWRWPQTIPLVLGAALCAMGTGPLTDAMQTYESSVAVQAKKDADAAPPRIFGLQACLVRYAQNHPADFYPASLGEVNAIVPACVEEDVAAARAAGGFRYEYTPTKDGGRIKRFTLLAEGVRSVGRLHYAFFSDESFVLRETDYTGIPPSQWRSYVPTGNLGPFLSGIQNHTWLEWKRTAWEKTHAQPAPVTFDSSELHYPDTLVESQAPGYFPRSNEPHDANSFADQSYAYSYEKILGPPENFRLEMRPRRYGVTGILSSYVDNTGIVRSTPQDRPAGPQDPAAYPCAYNLYAGDCAAPAGTGPVDPAKLFPRGTLNPPQDALHPGGLATDSTPVMFWRVNDNLPRFLAVSEDAQLVYATNLLTGISALRASDASPLWTLPGGVAAVPGPGALYALQGEGMLLRIDPAGNVLWRFAASPAKELIRARNGTLYVPGGYLFAVNESGALLWRMQLPEFGSGMPVLSADEKTLYLVSTAHLYGIDAERGALRWVVENSCRAMSPECMPQALANGDVAVESVVEHPGVTGWGRWSYPIRVLSADGKERWSREMSARAELVVPLGTSRLVVRSPNGLEILDARGTAVASLPGNWFHLSGTQRPGLFFACASDGLRGFDSEGRQVLYQPSPEPSWLACGAVHSGPANLLFLEKVDSAHELNELWTVMVP